MFLTDCWQVAAFATEVSEQVLTRMLLDIPVLLYRTAAGTAVAMQDRCPHRHVPLSMGRKCGDVIECGYHGLQFGPTGECLKVPGQALIPARARAVVYPLVERHGFIWIWMGDPALADPALVPAVPWMDDPAWAAAQGYHSVAADYRLLVDNLLDLSHETFVHPETIGNGAVADSPVSARTIDRAVVRVHRDMLDCQAPPQFQALGGFTGPIDRWHTTFYAPPGYCLIEVGAVAAGQAERGEGFARIINLITPATATTSHYFWAHARNMRIDDADLTDTIRASVAETFDQDKVILEAQQKAMGRFGVDGPGVVLAFDVGAVQGRRLLASVLDAQSGGEVRQVRHG